MTVTAIVAPDGAVVDSVMAEPDVALADRWPGMQLVAVPDKVFPNSRWKYVDGKFVPPPEETHELRSNQVDF